MTGIRIQLAINASPAGVWQELRHINRHVNWMHDAVSINFLSEKTEGEGTSFLCLTKIGPLQTRDLMTITQWKENEVMGVNHVGIIKGTGTFTLSEHSGGSLITWQEDLKFPWWALGPLGALVAKPILRLIWKKNLKNLKAIVESGER